MLHWKKCEERSVHRWQKKQKILVVDDEPEIREVLQMNAVQ